MPHAEQVKQVKLCLPASLIVQPYAVSCAASRRLGCQLLTEAVSVFSVRTKHTTGGLQRKIPATVTDSIRQCSAAIVTMAACMCLTVPLH
jgi:hypothetical protein